MLSVTKKCKQHKHGGWFGTHIYTHPYCLYIYMSYNKVSCNKTCITNTTCIYYKILMYCLKSTFIAKSGINKEFRKVI